MGQHVSVSEERLSAVVSGARASGVRETARRCGTVVYGWKSRNVKADGSIGDNYEVIEPHAFGEMSGHCGIVLRVETMEAAAERHKAKREAFSNMRTGKSPKKAALLVDELPISNRMRKSKAKRLAGKSKQTSSSTRSSSNSSTAPSNSSQPRPITSALSSLRSSCASVRVLYSASTPFSNPLTIPTTHPMTHTLTTGAATQLPADLSPSLCVTVFIMFGSLSTDLQADCILTAKSLCDAMVKGSGGGSVRGRESGRWRPLNSVFEGASVADWAVLEGDGEGDGTDPSQSQSSMSEDEADFVVVKGKLKMKAGSRIQKPVPAKKKKKKKRSSLKVTPDGDSDKVPNETAPERKVNFSEQAKESENESESESRSSNSSNSSNSSSGSNSSSKNSSSSDSLDDHKKKNFLRSKSAGKPAFSLALKGVGHSIGDKPEMPNLLNKSGKSMFNLPLPRDDDEMCATPRTPTSADTATMGKSELLRFYDPICSQVSEQIFMGGQHPARSKSELQKHKITHVLNCAGSVVPDCFPETFEYMTFVLNDGQFEDIECMFYAGMDFMQRAAAEGGAVYCHCHAGVSRSSTFVIAYLMWYNGWGVQETHEFVKRVRPTVSPNAGFMGQLLQWWARIHKPPQPRLYRQLRHSDSDKLIVLKLVAKDMRSWDAIDSRSCFVLHTADMIVVIVGEEVTPVFREALDVAIDRLHRYEKATQNVIHISAADCLAGDKLEDVSKREAVAALDSFLGSSAPPEFDAKQHVPKYESDYNPALRRPVKRMYYLLDNEADVEDANEAAAEEESRRALLYLYPNNITLERVARNDFEQLSLIDDADLDESFLYILFSNNDANVLYAWLGSEFEVPDGSPQREFAERALQAFLNASSSLFEERGTPQTCVVEEGEESDEFWDLFEA